METTTFLALFWGWFLVLIPLAYLLGGKSNITQAFKLVEDRGFALLAGYMAFVLGLATVLLHNVWIADWTLVITILGWLALIKGVMLIGLQKSFLGITNYFKKNYLLIQVLLVIMILLGAYTLLLNY